MTDQVNADWTELQVTIPAADTDRAGDIAQMVVPYGIYIEDYSHLEEEAMEIAHIDLIDEDLLKKDRTKSIIHVYISPEENPAEAISFLKERFEAVGIENTITAANCAEEDWINNWKKYFKPIPVGNRLLVRPMWEDEYEAGDRVVLHLEPGLAFGTASVNALSFWLVKKTRYFPFTEIYADGIGHKRRADIDEHAFLPKHNAKLILKRPSRTAPPPWAAKICGTAQKFFKQHNIVFAVQRGKKDPV